MELNTEGLLALHDKAVDAYNNALAGSEEERQARTYATAVLDCIASLNLNVGREMMRQNMRVMEQTDAPMCGGLLLKYPPKKRISQ